MKKVLVSLLVFTVVLSLSISVFAANFSDTARHWAKDPIDSLSKDGVITGYADNTFKPDNYVTRAEFSTMIVKMFEPEEEANLSSYRDVSQSAWYYEAIAKIVAMGPIEGDNNTTIRPNDYITRQEAVVILNRIINLQAGDEKALSIYSDAGKIASWAKNAIVAYTENGYLNGYEDGTFRPTENITRAEAAKILREVVCLIITEPGEYDLKGYAGSVIVKANNVTLKNTDDIDRVFTLNDDVDNSLKSDVKSDNITVINKNEKESSGRSGHGTITRRSTITVDPSSDGGYYVVRRNGANISKSDNIKITIEVNGEANYVNNVVATNEDALRNGIINIIRNELDVGMVMNTLRNEYGDVEQIREWGLLTVKALPNLSNDERAQLRALFNAADSAEQIYAVYDGLMAIKYDENTIRNVAIEMLENFTLDDLISALKQVAK